MMPRFNRVLLILPLLLVCGTATAQTVRFKTNLGDIDVALLPANAQQTVANFLKYMNRGSYNSSVIHRSVRGFIIQGGGYKFENGNLPPIPQDPPVRNEYAVSNIRGTIAMAKLGNDPNSATNQWFFNLSDNSSNLNNTNGGFTVFGRITNTVGLAVMDRIAAVPITGRILALPEMPLINYNAGNPIDGHAHFIQRGWGNAVPKVLDRPSSAIIASKVGPVDFEV